MTMKSLSSLKYGTPTLTTTAVAKPQKTNIRVSMMNPRKNKINIIKKNK